MSNASDLLDFTGIRYYDAFAQAWASGVFATKAELSAAMEQAGRAYHYCGSVPSVDDLPSSASVGDVYNIDAAPVWSVLPETASPGRPPYNQSPYAYRGTVTAVEALPANPNPNDIYLVAGSVNRYYCWAETTPGSESYAWTVLPEGSDPGRPPYNQLPYVYRGEVESFDDLPEDAAPSDIYLVGGSVNRYYSYVVNPLDGENYAWMEDSSAGVSGWDRLGDLVDLAGYVRSDNIPTPSTPGLLSPSDKAKLDSIDWGATSNVVDSALSSSTSSGWESRLVCNSAVTHALEGKLGISQVVSGGTWVDGSWSGAANGAMIASDKRKLDDIDDSANYFSLSPAGSASLGGVIVDAGVYTTYSSGASPAGDARIPYSEVAYHVVQNKAVYDALQLKLDRSQAAVPGTYVSDGSGARYEGGSNGAMTGADKAKLDGIDVSANLFVLSAATSSSLGGVIVDKSLSSDSENPVQNKAVWAECSSVMSSAADLVGGLSASAFGALASKLDKTQSATATADGVMTSSDWEKLSGISSGAAKVIIDTALNSAADADHTVANSAIAVAIGSCVPLAGNVNIGGVKTFTSKISGSITGSAAVAPRLATARTISLTGDVSGASVPAFDGTADVNISVSIDDYHVSGGTGVRGLVPAAPASAVSAGYFLNAGGSYVAASAIANSTFVHLSGNGSDSTAVEDITGVKVFSQSPIVPAPAEGYDYLGVAFGARAVAIYFSADVSGDAAAMSSAPPASAYPSGTPLFFRRNGLAANVFRYRICSSSPASGWVWASVAPPTATPGQAVYILSSGENMEATRMYAFTAGQATLGACGGECVVVNPTKNQSGVVSIGDVFVFNGGAKVSRVAAVASETQALHLSTTYSAVNYDYWWQRDSGQSSFSIVSGASPLLQAANLQSLEGVEDALVDAAEGVAGARVSSVEVGADRHVVVSFPRYNIADLGFSSGGSAIWSGTSAHAGFMLPGAVVQSIKLGKYEASLDSAGTGFCTVPGAAPMLCGNAGTGVVSGACGPMPNAMWAARALWAYVQKGGAGSAVFHGNFFSGRDVASPWQTGVLVVNDTVTLTGTGPVGWCDDGTAEGLADFAGNVWELVAGARVVDGEIQIVSGGSDLAVSPEDMPWKAIDASGGTLVEPGTAGTLKYGGSESSIVIGTSGPSGDLAGTFQSVSFGDVSDAAKKLLFELCLAPIDGGQTGAFSMPASGTAYLCRGGDCTAGSGGGLFAMRFTPEESIDDAGVRLAFTGA